MRFLVLLFSLLALGLFASADDACTNYCLNGGVCTLVNSAPTCQCTSSFSGTTCQFQTFSAPLTGASEVPPVVSGFTGKTWLVLNTVSSTFNLWVVSNVTFASAAHIHRAAITATGGVMFGLTVTNGIPQNASNVAITAADVTLLRNAGLYLNIHTAAFPAGACRGQLMPADACSGVTCQNGGTCVANLFSFTCQCATDYAGTYCETSTNPCIPNPCFNSGQCSRVNDAAVCTCPSTYFGSECQKRSFVATLSPAAEIPPTTSFFSGKAWVAFNTVSFAYELSIVTNVMNPTAAHIHRGVAGVAGNVMSAIQVVSGVLQNTTVPVPVAGTDAPRFDALGLYINVHTTQYPSGVIRGQLLPLDSTDVCYSFPCQNGGQCTSAPGGTFTCDCSKTAFFGPTCNLRGVCDTIQEENNAYWGRSLAASKVYGTCLGGSIGTIYRTCFVNGTFGPITGTCLPSTTSCAANSYGHAQWEATPIGTTATGLCDTGFSGNPQRRCKADGTWEGSLFGTLCTLTPCGSTTGGNAQWNSTPQGRIAYGICDANYIGNPTRACLAPGVWGAISNPCRPTGNCPAERYGRADWDITAPGQRATGRCIFGWTGSPLRICKADGVWQDLINNHCQRVA